MTIVGYNIPCLLIGNKIDLIHKRKITKKEGKMLALQWGCLYKEISVKDDS